MTDIDPALIEQAEDAALAAWRSRFGVLASPEEHSAEVARAVLEAVADDLRADAWDDGYVRGVLDTTSDLEPADNPYRRSDQ